MAKQSQHHQHQQQQGADYAKEDHSAQHRGDMASHQEDANSSEAGQRGHHQSL